MGETVQDLQSALAGVTLPKDPRREVRQDERRDLVVTTGGEDLFI